MKAFISLLCLLLGLCNLYAQNYCTDKLYCSHLQAHKLNGRVKELNETHWRHIRHHSDSALDISALEYVMVYQYNHWGNLSQMVQYRKDSSIANIERKTYDSAQKVSIHIQYAPEHIDEMSTCSCQYNASGYAVKELITMYNGTIVKSQMKLHYDRKGRLVKKVSIIPGLQDTITLRIKYNATGKPDRSVLYRKYWEA